MKNLAETAARNAAANPQVKEVKAGWKRAEPTTKPDLDDDDDAEALRVLLLPYNFSESGPLDASFEKV
ncbi:hypothetical protein KA012_04930 [Candidatus Woesebacteria bacterium]|nr:hypothetical protein [Candidatus Woesebacteria bacterium]